MPRTSTLASVEIDVAEKSQSAAVVDPDQPFRILVMGNFSGGAGRNRRPIEIDRDNFDQVLALLAPELRLSFGGIEVPVRFRDTRAIFIPTSYWPGCPCFRSCAIYATGWRTPPHSRRRRPNWSRLPILPNQP